jgi:hypothetical protein
VTFSVDGITARHHGKSYREWRSLSSYREYNQAIVRVQTYGEAYSSEARQCIWQKATVGVKIYRGKNSLQATGHFFFRRIANARGVPARS